MVAVKIGVIARCDNRGIAYQSWEAVLGLQPERVLVVMMNDRRWPEEPGRFARTNAIYVDSDMTTRALDESKMRKFLKGLDSVFAVETLYDWRMVDIADELGVKIVVQGNPEFYTHHQFPERPQPHQWIWPTTWKLDGSELPDGPLVPVPAPASPSVAAADPDDETLRVLHVAGHRAIGDRNGTDLVIESLPLMGSKIHMTIVGQDGALPAHRVGRYMTVETFPQGVADRWQMYRNQHIVLLPRRYGGLSLPAIEACTVGAVPMMPDVPENGLWPIHPLDARPGRLQRVPFGRVDTWMVRPNSIAAEVDKLSRDRARLEAEMNRAADWALNNDWSSWKNRYLDVLKP